MQKVLIKPTVELVVGHDGSIYLHGKADDVVCHNKPLFFIKGKFQTGQAAVAAMARGSNWVTWDVTGDSIVFCRAAGVPTMPSGPMPLNKVLGVLESAGHVRVRVHKHGCAEREPTDSSKYIVKKMEVNVLLPNLAEEGEATVANISHYCSVPAIKDSQHLMTVHVLDFVMKDKMLMCDYPAVFLQKPLRLKQGEFLQLAVPDIAAPGAAAAGV